VSAIVALIIIGREIAISALREWMAQIGASRSVAVHMVGKLKTAAQMAAIMLLLYDAPLPGLSEHWAHARFLGTWLIYAACGLTIWSMVYYLKRSIPDILAKAR
jgi:cardiolipin synthase